MIGVIFEFNGELFDVRVNQSEVYFRNQKGSFCTIEGLKLSKGGVQKEFPDLINDDDWRLKAINRFKEKIMEYKTEQEKIKYIINDLKKFGYTAKVIQREGFRPVKIKDDYK
jgi:hypothetical protein